MWSEPIAYLPICYPLVVEGVQKGANDMECEEAHYDYVRESYVLLKIIVIGFLLANACYWTEIVPISLTLPFTT